MSYGVRGNRSYPKTTCPMSHFLCLLCRHWCKINLWIPNYKQIFWLGLGDFFRNSELCWFVLFMISLLLCTIVAYVFFNWAVSAVVVPLRPSITVCLKQNIFIINDSPGCYIILSARNVILTVNRSQSFVLDHSNLALWYLLRFFHWSQCEFTVYFRCFSHFRLDVNVICEWMM